MKYIAPSDKTPNATGMRNTANGGIPVERLRRDEVDEHGGDGGEDEQSAGVRVAHALREQRGERQVERYDARNQKHRDATAQARGVERRRCADPHALGLLGARRQGPHVAAAFGKAGGIPLVDDREAEQKCDDGQHERPERQRNHRVRPGERESEHRPERHGDGMAQAVVADPSPRRDVGSTSDAHVVAAVLTDA